MRLELDYKEDRGFLDSFFIIQGSDIKVDMLESWLASEGVV